MISLPPALQAAVEAALRAVPGSQWKSAARNLSTRYRTGREGGEGPLARGAPAALGYAGLILPAAYAQLYGAMAATAARIPAWRPRTLLDLGSGPGTALWAAAACWPSLQQMTAWEREPAFLDLGRRLAQASPDRAVAGAQWERVVLGAGPLPGTERYDLVVLGHVLNELDPAARQAVVEAAWKCCRGVLLLVEPGTPAGFAVIRALRDALLPRGARTIAPCAHDRPCPLLGDWCHFPQRLDRPAFQRRVKEGTAGWEDAKFSYAALARFGPAAPIWGRLIHQPQVHKGTVELIVSSVAGIVRPEVPKRDRPAYRAAADHRWGDALAAPPPGAIVPPPPPGEALPE